MVHFYGVRIANGASLSDPVDIRGGILVGLVMPATWDAATITLQGTVLQSPESTAAWKEVQEIDSINGAAVAVQFAVAANIYYCLKNPLDTMGLRHIKVRSGTAGVPVNQTAQRDFHLLVRQ